MGKLNWFKNEPTEWAKYASPEEIVEGIDILTNILYPHIPEQGIRFYISNIFGQNRIDHQYIGVKKVKSALKHKHSDLSIFMYVNALSKYVVTNESGHKRTEWDLSHNSSNFVMDLDTSPFNTVEDLIFNLKKTKCPLPVAIVTTSKNNYHLLYKGGIGEWTEEKRFAIAKRLSRYSGVESKEHIDAHLKEFGIDAPHLRLKPRSMKIRMPFTINGKRSRGFMGDVVKTTLWINPGVTNPKKIALVQLSEKELRVKRFREEYSHMVTSRIKFLERELKGVFSKQDVEIYSELLGTGWGKLYFNNCRIKQEFWAEVWDIPQPKISRRLRKLVDMGYLIEVKAYLVGSYAKTYGAGPKLTALYNKYRATECHYETYDIHMPYEDGKGWLHFLRDIRALCYRKYTEDEVVRFINEKQSFRDPSRMRTVRDIRNAFRDNMIYIAKHYPSRFSKSVDA